jgi:hypothetical protein
MDAAVRGQVETLLESFARTRSYIPTDAERICEPLNLPNPLQQIAWLCERSNLVWEAWGDRAGVRFLAGELVDANAPWVTHPKVRILFFDFEGRPTARGIWTQTPDGGWALRNA